MVPNPYVPMLCPTCFHLIGTMQEQLKQLQIPAMMRTMWAVGRRVLGGLPPSSRSLSHVLIKLFYLAQLCVN